MYRYLTSYLFVVLVFDTEMTELLTDLNVTYTTYGSLCGIVNEQLNYYRSSNTN